MVKKLDLPSVLIERFYIDGKLSISETAYRLNVSPTLIRHIMVETGIPRRNTSEATLLAHKQGKFAHRKGIGELGSANPHWKGGRSKTNRGYIRVYLYPSDPFYPMADLHTHNVLEHRLIIAQHLGRCLYPYEQVHHINGIKDDNRFENLELIADNAHGFKSRLCRNCKLRKRIHILATRIKELEAQLQGNLIYPPIYS